MIVTVEDPQDDNHKAGSSSPYAGQHTMTCPPRRAARTREAKSLSAARARPRPGAPWTSTEDAAAVRVNIPTADRTSTSAP